MINHPITPPPELMKEWIDAWYNAKVKHANMTEFVAIQAARWGADQQLDQDAKWLDTNALFSHNLTITPSGGALRQVMRPKPPSLKEQALNALLHMDQGQHNERAIIIRRALEQLDD